MIFVNCIQTTFEGCLKCDVDDRDGDDDRVTVTVHTVLVALLLLIG